MKDLLYKLIASLFFIGYFPVASGTVGSLLGLCLYYFIKDNSWLMGITIIFATILGMISSGKAEEIFAQKDDRKIVIDEFTGMLVALYLLPMQIGYIISAFLLFRFFDIVKPIPIARLERIKGSFGIMIDDLMAGIYANLILQVVYRVLG